jgi:hypothetical protein
VAGTELPIRRYSRCFGYQKLRNSLRKRNMMLASLNEFFLIVHVAVFLGKNDNLTAWKTKRALSIGMAMTAELGNPKVEFLRILTSAIKFS